MSCEHLLRCASGHTIALTTGVCAYCGYKAVPVVAKAKLAKQPIGIMPSYVWKYKRILEIMRAIIRYDDAGLPTNVEWHEELRELVAVSKASDQGAAP